MLLSHVAAVRSSFYHFRSAACSLRHRCSCVQLKNVCLLQLVEKFLLARSDGTVVVLCDRSNSNSSLRSMGYADSPMIKATLAKDLEQSFHYIANNALLDMTALHLHSLAS